MKIDKFLRDSELELGILDSASNLISWDQYTLAPSETSERKSIEAEYFADLMHNKLTEISYKQTINKLSNNKRLPIANSAIVRLRKKQIDKITKFPIKFIREQERIRAVSICAWEKAREENKFSIFAPHLENLISLQIKEASFLKKDPYECALSNYDETLSVNEVTEILSSFKEYVIPLIHKKRKTYNLPANLYPKETQKLLAKYLINLIGLDKNTVVGETTHPFQMSLAHKDNRIALSFKENDIIFGALTILHEGGHALYQQGMPADICNTILSDSPGMSLHESQSRFYETIIGQSYNFTKLYFKQLVKLFPEQFKSISLDHYYNSVNNVEKSFIRISADELTYCIHIIIRFELEKRLLDRSLKVKDLPKEWNRLYKNYLGVTPTNMKNGVLQDIHWGDGSFGYFPSYVVGNVLAGMFSKLLEKDLKSINRNSLLVIKNKLKTKLHRHGAIYEPKDMVKKIFGSDIDVKPYVTYLTNKYG